jgi:gliding motility-associated-like protein
VWSGPDLSCTNCASPEVTPAATTTYTLLGFDANGCENYDSVTVNIEPLPNVVISNDTAICANSSLQLNATGGSMHVWTPATNLSCDTCSNPVATPVGDETYTVQAFTAFGCESTAMVTIDTIGLPDIAAPAVGTICEGESVQLSASGGIAYNWSPAASLNNPNVQNPVASPDVSTTYTVTGYDANGCADTAEVFVKVNSLSSGGVFSADTGICIDQSVELFANGFTQYEWAPASSLSCTDCSNPIATPTTTTIYSVAVEDDNGCADTGTVQVTVHPLPEAVATTQKDTICQAASTTLEAQGGVEYKWTPSLGLNNPNLQTPLASPPSSTEYTVEVTDANGCMDDTTLAITVIPRPNTTVEPDKSICLNDTTTIEASGADAYQWAGPGILSCEDCAVVEVSPSNTATYTVTGFLDNGCSKTAEHTLTVNPLPSNVEVSADTNICIGDQANLHVEGGDSYSWMPGADLSCTNCTSPVASPTASTTYTVEVFNTYGCSITDSTEVIVSSPATVEVTPDTGVCPGGSIQLQVVGAATYNWLPPEEMDDPQSATPVVTPSAARHYVVEMKDALGCDIVDSVYVDIYTPAEPMASEDTLICIGSQAQLRAHNGVAYNWLPNETLTGSTSAMPVAQPEETTTYTVYITDDNGCENTDEIKVTVQPLPNITITGDQAIYEKSTATIVVSGAKEYYWNPVKDIIDSSKNAIVVYPEETTVYQVLGVDRYGCENEASTTVEVVERAEVYLPNAFTPNQDGKNDVFTMKHNSNFTLESLQIFNRWGKLVFETTDPDKGWDGTINGVPQPAGVYVYQLQAKDKLGKPIEKHGNVTLMR